MTPPFPADQLEQERPDPIEGTSPEWLYALPAALFALFLGFGLTYLTLLTPNAELGDGDTRTEATERSPSASEEQDPLVARMEMGEGLYKRHCQACHQPHGRGLAGTFPPLVDSGWVLESPSRLTAIVLHGMQGEIKVDGIVYNGVMTPFKQSLDSEEVAALTTYVRNSWGNEAPPVSVELVEAVWQATEDKSRPWQGSAELDEQDWSAFDP